MQGIVCLQRRRGKALCAGSGSADASGTSSVWGKHSRGIADCADRHHASKQHVLLAVLLLDIHRRYSAVSVWPLVAGSYRSPCQPGCEKLPRLRCNTHSWPYTLAPSALCVQLPRITVWGAHTCPNRAEFDLQHPREQEMGIEGKKIKFDL